jgi:hypothetical protein
MKVNDILTESVLIEGKIADFIARGKQIISSLKSGVPASEVKLVKSQAQDQVKQLVKQMFSGNIKSREQLTADILKISRGIDGGQKKLSEQYQDAKPATDTDLVNMYQNASIQAGTDQNNLDDVKHHASGLGLIGSALSYPLVYLYHFVEFYMPGTDLSSWSPDSGSEWYTGVLVGLATSIIYYIIARIHYGEKYKKSKQRYDYLNTHPAVVGAVQRHEAQKKQQRELERQEMRYQEQVRNQGLYDYLKEKRSEVGLTYQEQDELHDLYRAGYR